MSRLTTSILLTVLVAQSSGLAFAAEPGRLLASPLLVAPRDAPRSQLVSLRFEGEAQPADWDAKIAIGSAAERPAHWIDGAHFPGGRAVVVPPIDAPTRVSIAAIGTGWTRAAEIELRPIESWTLYLVQHTHTDIGYTAYPSRINIDQLAFIDEAVRACRLTDDYPDDARFRWTCEATWAVERYVNERPAEDVTAFLDRVRQGRIDVTAMRMNMTDLSTEEAVIRNFLPVRRLRKLGIPIRTAMQCDVNGYPWALAEILDEIGVVGLAGGINQTRSTLPYPTPRAIQWQSPSGGDVVAWRGEHYLYANMLGFRESVQAVLGKLPGYLKLLRKRGYPHSIMLLQQGGYFTDNATACHRASDLVREWNEHFAAPRLRMATLSEWFDALAKTKTPPEPTMKAWPDWWADGVGSAPLEAAVIREAQEDLLFSTTFLSLARAARSGLADRRADARQAYLFASIYDEHTFGAAESISQPMSVNTRSQWEEKSSNAYRARWRSRELVEAALRTWAPTAVPRGRAGVVVFNSLPWQRDAPVAVEMPRGIVEDDTPFRIVDVGTGAEVPYRIGSGHRNYREVEMIARAVPAVGYRAYRIDVGKAPAPAPTLSAQGAKIANGLVEVELDSERGGIASIRALPGGENVVDREHEYGFGQFVHERIVHGRGRWHLWPMVDYEKDSFSRTVTPGASIDQGIASPVRASARMKSEVSTPDGPITIETEVSLWQGLPSVFIANRVSLPGTTHPVAGYIAFPFAGGEAPRAEVVGGVMEPGRDQIPGSAADWHAIQRWVRFGGGDRAATWVTLDVPLVHFGGLNIGRWTKGLTLDEPLVYSWVSNNYWFTNFVASQAGDFEFRYVVEPGAAGQSDAAAHRVGRESCSPLRALVVDGTGAPTAPAMRSLLTIEPAVVDLVGMKEAEDEDGTIVLRVRNRSESSVDARIELGAGWTPREVVHADLIENAIAPIALDGRKFSLSLPPWKLATVLIRCRPLSDE